MHKITTLQAIVPCLWLGAVNPSLSLSSTCHVRASSLFNQFGIWKEGIESIVTPVLALIITITVDLKLQTVPS